MDVVWVIQEKERVGTSEVFEAPSISEPQKDLAAIRSLENKRQCKTLCFILLLQVAWCFFLCISLFKAEQQKKAAIVSAEGDAIGADLLSVAFKKAGNSLIELRKIEASEEIAHNMAGNKNIVYLPEGQGVLMNMPAH